MAAAFSLGVSLLEEEDVLRAVLQEATGDLRQLKAASVAWCNHVRRYLCNRLWVRLCRREGQGSLIDGSIPHWHCNFYCVLVRKSKT